VRLVCAAAAKLHDNAGFERLSFATFGVIVRIGTCSPRGYDDEHHLALYVGGSAQSRTSTSMGTTHLTL
jgi:hypothetical protein